jgi:hypothetical protein
MPLPVKRIFPWSGKASFAVKFYAVGAADFLTGAKCAPVDEGSDGNDGGARR